VAFTTTLSRYELLARPAAAPSANAGQQGYAPEFDIINRVNGDVIVTTTRTPLQSAVPAMTTAGVATTAIVSYKNAGGGLMPDTTLAALVASGTAG
jgi:hypothetical protein